MGEYLPARPPPGGRSTMTRQQAAAAVDALEASLKRVFPEYRSTEGLATAPSTPSETTERDTNEPQTTEPETTEPETAEPEIAEPEAAESITIQSAGVETRPGAQAGPVLSSPPPSEPSPEPPGSDRTSIDLPRVGVSGEEEEIVLGPVEILERATRATLEWPGRPDWSYIVAGETDLSIHAPRVRGDHPRTGLVMPLGPGRHRLTGQITLSSESRFAVEVTVGVKLRLGAEITLFAKQFQPGESERLEQSFEVIPHEISKGLGAPASLVITCRMAPGATNNWGARVTMKELALTTWRSSPSRE